MFYSDTFRFATVSILKMVEILLNKLKISFIFTFICNKKASTLYLNLGFVFFFVIQYQTNVLKNMNTKDQNKMIDIQMVNNLNR